MDRWMTILATQVWVLPFLAIYIIGLVFALSRRDIGNASQYAAFGFGLLILGLVLSSINMYSMIALRERSTLSAFATYSMLFRFGTMAFNLGGWGFILAAIFAKRPPVASRVE